MHKDIETVVTAAINIANEMEIPKAESFIISCAVSLAMTLAHTMQAHGRPGQAVIDRIIEALTELRGDIEETQKGVLQ